MKIDLGLESLQNDKHTVSFEELMVDICELQNDLMQEQELISGFENCISLLESIHQHGITDTIKDVIGDQITYTSQEELVASLEGVLGKILDNTFANISSFNSKTKEFDTNPKDAIMRLQQLITACIKEAGTHSSHDKVCEDFLLEKIKNAIYDLEQLIKMDNIHATAKNKETYQDGIRLKPTNFKNGSSAILCKVTLQYLNEKLNTVRRWLGSTDMRNAISNFKNGNIKTSSRSEDNLVKLVIDAKKQFRIIAQCVMRIYTGLRKHRLRKNAHDAKDVKAI